MRGLLPVWKEKGMTSHDVIFKLRKLLGMKKIGHTGTLDPEVDGVLLVCLGEATKLVQLLMEGEKSYLGTITLGFSTETEDATGAIVDKKSVLDIPSLSQVDNAMQAMLGQIQQVPPYYSAVKVNGKRLYEYARKGIEVQRPSRQVTIHRFVRTSDLIYDDHNQTVTWHFAVDCSKGTYVRTLAVDLGKSLGYPAHMSDLTRTATGGCTKDQALTLSQIEAAMNEGRLDQSLISIEEALSFLETVHLDEAQYHDVKVGKVLAEDYFGPVIENQTLFHWQNKAVAIYGPHPTKPGLIKPVRMFVQYEK